MPKPRVAFKETHVAHFTSDSLRKNNRIQRIEYYSAEGYWFEKIGTVQAQIVVWVVFGLVYPTPVSIFDIILQHDLNNSILQLDLNKLKTRLNA
jgi:hypothetical protein